jgi:hypothetical protein
MKHYKKITAEMHILRMKLLPENRDFFVFALYFGKKISVAKILFFQALQN